MKTSFDARPGRLVFSRAAISNPMSRISILKEFWLFLKTGKRWWITPIVVCLVLLGFLLVWAGGSAVAPFIYSLF